MDFLVNLKTNITPVLLFRRSGAGAVLRGAPAEFPLLVAAVPSSQWERIRHNQEWIAIYHGTDDPLIPIAEPRFVAKQLKCSYFELEDRGHFTGARELPEVVRYLERKLVK